MKYVACYGDSLVQGFPFGPRYSWTAQVEKLTQIKMLNYGVCGDCCDDIIYRMRQYALPEYVQHVLFLGGANDILQGRRIEDISRDYKRVLEWCEEKHYSLCVVLPFISTEQALNRQLLNLRQEAEHICGGKAFLLIYSLSSEWTPAPASRPTLTAFIPNLRRMRRWEATLRR